MSRRDKILESLRAGNKIRRQWKGSNLSGYLSYQLEGVPRLRETEVEELGDLVIAAGHGSHAFPPLRLRTDEDRAEAAKRKADAEAAEAERQRAQDEKRVRMNELWIELGVIDTLRSIGCNGERIAFEFNGHRYEIKEID